VAWKGISLNSYFSNKLENYKEGAQRLVQSFPIFFCVQERSLFFDVWFRHHQKLIQLLSEEELDGFEEINKEFLKKRSRLASVFMQRIKLDNKTGNELSFFKEILKQHDEIFKTVLGEILNYFSEELIRAQRFRKVTAAYVHANET
jgi:hypothetical protein